ncbi:proline-rich protein 2-like [Oryza brachyantha]|uniref:Proline-rich protein n=1 Tax=Oryza brachyantha TaxID=4533 RepID=J3N0X4_ORYBR|nr:proline-rich protein 2-like [Oryza brachyantha]
MGALPRALLLGVCAAAVLLANVTAGAAEGGAMVVGLAKCADCTRKNMKAEAVFKGLRVAVKCKNSNGEYETKATGEVGKSGAFAVPLAAGLLREDGELSQRCFAQLHSASSNRPCPGQEPSWIATDAERNTLVAVAGKTTTTATERPPAECASAFLCDPFHKKDFFFHFKNPSPPAPAYTHPHPAPPVYGYPTPVPTYHKPPTPAYSHPAPVYSQPKRPSTPIYHPPAEEKKVVTVQDAETEPELFKMLLPLIKKNPLILPKVPKIPPVEKEAKP